jgi:hypothetical protein
MKTRTIVTTVALGVCLGLSTGPAQAALTQNGLNWNGIPLNGLPLNGLPLNGLPLNGLTTNGLPLHGLSYDVAHQPTNGAQVVRPGVPSERLPFQSISQQGLGKR